MTAAATQNTDPFDLVRAEVMLRGYDCRWSSDMALYEVLAVEAEFRAPLVNPMTKQASRTWRIGGKLDVIVRERRQDRELIVEHKTSTDDVTAGSEYWRRLRIDGQISQYYEGAKQLGYDVEGCIYDVLKKPRQLPSTVAFTDDAGVKIVLGPDGQRVRTKDGKKWRETGDAAQGYVLQARPETPDEYRLRLLETVAADPNAFFARGEVVRLEAEMSEALYDVWQLGKQIREAELAGRFPRNPDACVRWGRTCEYFDVCTGTASIEDTGQFQRVRVLHPELSVRREELEHMSQHNLLTASRLSCARACQRMHQLKYGLGYRPVAEAETLRFGSLIHRGLEAWWLARDGERLEAALAAINAVPIRPNGAAAYGDV
jgi:hypothetical protein